MIQVAIARDLRGWHEKFLMAASDRGADQIAFSEINIEAADWLAQVAAYDAVIWKPSVMGAKASSHVREKIYFIEHYLKKLVIPNYATVWHFESKIAQSYLFSHFGVATPETVVSFDANDALMRLKEAKYPLVFKDSSGAGSKNVRLIQSHTEAERIVRRRFAVLNADESIRHSKSTLGRLGRRVTSGAIATRVIAKLRREERFQNIYWQEFIPGNAADLRIVIIGARFAVGFWRGNRPGDFRASGSGRLDYVTEIPPTALELCFQISRQLDFDSMAYDLLWRDGKPLVVEMSFGYLDSAVHAAGHYYRRTDNAFVRVNRAVWPQALWIDWALERLGAESKIGCDDE